MNKQIVNRLNQLLFFILILSPLLSYFVVTMSPIDSGIYFFNALIFCNVVVLLLHAAATGRLVFPLYLKCLFLFSIYVIISDLLIANKSITGIYFFKDQILFGFFAALIIENTTFDKAYIKNMTVLMKFIFWASLVAMLFQQFGDYNFMLNPNTRKDFEATAEMERRFASIYSYLGGPLLAGLTVIPILGLIIAEKMRSDGKQIGLYFLAASLFSIIIKSRWVIINLVLVVLVRYNPKRTSFSGVLRLLLGTAVISVSCFYVFSLLNFDITGLIQERFLETGRGGLSKGAASSRLLAFDVFGDLFPDNPLFGKGNLKWGEGASGDKELEALLKGRSSQIHVGYLSLFYFYGVAGSIPFLLFLYNLMKKLRFNARRNNYYGAYWGIMGFVVANLTLVWFNINVIGLLLCLVYNKYYEDVYKRDQLIMAQLNEQEEDVETSTVNDEKPVYHEA